MFFESFLINIGILLILLIALIFDYVIKFFSYWYIRHVPYKISIPFFGSDYHRTLFLRNTSDEVKSLCSKHSKENFVGCVKSRIPDLIVKDPEVVRRILSTDHANFHSKGLDLDKSRDVCIRNNLFYSENDKWTLLRSGYETLLNNLELEMENGLHECLSGTNGDENVQQLLSKILDIVFQDLLLCNKDGSSIKDLRQQVQKRTMSEKLKSYLKNIFPSLYTLLGLKTLPDKPSDKLKEILEQSKLMTKIKKAGSVFQFDIKEKNRRHFKRDFEIDFAYSILSSFIMEGYVPLHYLLTSLLFELALNQDIQRNAREALNGNDEYVNKIIKEALRLHSPYSVVTRRCTKPYYCDDKFLIDKGVTITIPLQYIHREQKYFKNPDEFNPDRFVEDNTSFLAFGAGPRKCIGEDLTFKIARQVLKAVLGKYAVEPSTKTPKQLPVTDHNFGRVINGDVWLKFVQIK